jgi:CRP-like cAMP-binding protein
MTTASDALRRVPMFEGMTDRAIDAIGEMTVERSFPVGSDIVREGDPGDAFYVLVEGRAAVSQAGVAVRELRAGDFFGEIALFDGGPRTATVTATEPIRALVVDRDGFRRLIEEHPVVRLDVVTALAQRLRQRAPAATD